MVLEGEVISYGQGTPVRVKDLNSFQPPEGADRAAKCRYLTFLFFQVLYVLREPNKGQHLVLP